MATFDVDALAVFIAFAANLLLGFVWYSPVLFGERWLMVIGKTRQQWQQEFTVTNALTIIFSALLSAWVLGIIIDWAGANSLQGGAMVGLLVGLGLVSASKAVNLVCEQRPTRLFLIYACHDVCAHTLMGALFGVWTVA